MRKADLKRGIAVCCSAVLAVGTVLPGTGVLAVAGEKYQAVTEDTQQTGEAGTDFVTEEAGEQENVRGGYYVDNYTKINDSKLYYDNMDFNADYVTFVGEQKYDSYIYTNGGYFMLHKDEGSRCENASSGCEIKQSKELTFIGLDGTIKNISNVAEDGSNKYDVIYDVFGTFGGEELIQVKKDNKVGLMNKEGNIQKLGSSFWYDEMSLFTVDGNSYLLLKNYTSDTVFDCEIVQQVGTVSAVKSGCQKITKCGAYLEFQMEDGTNVICDFAGSERLKNVTGSVQIGYTHVNDGTFYYITDKAATTVYDNDFNQLFEVSGAYSSVSAAEVTEDGTVKAYSLRNGNSMNRCDSTGQKWLDKDMNIKKYVNGVGGYCTDNDTRTTYFISEDGSVQMTQSELEKSFDKEVDKKLPSSYSGKQRSDSLDSSESGIICKSSVKITYKDNTKDEFEFYCICTKSSGYTEYTVLNESGMGYYLKGTLYVFEKTEPQSIECNGNQVDLKYRLTGYYNLTNGSTDFQKITQDSYYASSTGSTVYTLAGVKYWLRAGGTLEEAQSNTTQEDKVTIGTTGYYYTYVCENSEYTFALYNNKGEVVKGGITGGKRFMSTYLPINGGMGENSEYALDQLGYTSLQYNNSNDDPVEGDTIYSYTGVPVMSNVFIASANKTGWILCYKENENSDCYSYRFMRVKNLCQTVEDGVHVDENGSIHYYKDGEEDTAYTGMAADSDGNRYWFDNGTAARDKQVYSPADDAWYWFDANGTMAVGKDVFIPKSNEDRSEGKWVRYDENGHMVKGEDYANGGWYRFDETTGEMAKGFYSVEDSDTTKLYYYNEDTGIMEHGAVNIDGTEYAFDDETGVAVNKAWYSVDNAPYWYENGIRQGMEGRGKEIYDPASDGWYWLDAVDGGKKAVSKDVYQESYAGAYADREDGTGKWVRYDENGRMIKGWSEQNGNRYYFDPITGAMAKGTAAIDGTTYTFSWTTGALQ